MSTRHWREDSELAEPLKRVLDSGGVGEGDDAALERMGARIEAALGPAFDARRAGQGTSTAWHNVRRVGIGVVAAAAVSITWWSSMASPSVPSSVASRRLQPEAASIQRSDEVIAPPVVAAASASEVVPPEPARPAPSRKHRARAAAAAPGLAEELKGLSQIRGFLEASPERALAAVNEQELRFTRGALDPERQLLRLDALLRLGRTSEAQTLATQLMAATENHPYKARIAELLARRR